MSFIENILKLIKHCESDFFQQLLDVANNNTKKFSFVYVRKLKSEGYP